MDVIRDVVTVAVEVDVGKITSPDPDEYSNGPQKYDVNTFCKDADSHVAKRSAILLSVTIVALVSELTVKLLTATPLIVTPLTFQKPVPVRFTVVPPTNDPCVTSKDVTDMTGQYVQRFVPVADVKFDVTTTLPVPFALPAPVTTVICVTLSTV